MAKVKRHAFDVVQLETFEPVVKELEDLERLVLVFEQNSAQDVYKRQHFTIARRGFDSLCFLLNQWVKNNSPLNLPKEEGLAKPSEIQ